MPTPERTSVEEIVAAGREILEASGPQGLTMQAVAARVGVRAPSLYKRVRDREALLTAVATASIDALTARLVTAWATGFLQMELSGAFRLGGDVDRAFEYGLRHLTDGLVP